MKLKPSPLAPEGQQKSKIAYRLISTNPNEVQVIKENKRNQASCKLSQIAYSYRTEFD